jgi:hypothetical protein
VVVAVEVVRADQVGNAVEGLVVEQQRAEQGLLGLDRVRRDLERKYVFLSSASVRRCLSYRHPLLSPPL